MTGPGWLFGAAGGTGGEAVTGPGWLFGAAGVSNASDSTPPVLYPTDADMLDRIRRFATLPDDGKVYEGEFMRGFTVGDASCRKQLREILGIEE